MPLPAITKIHQPPMTTTNFTSREMSERLTRIRSKLQEEGLDGLICCDPANVRYATGFKGEPRILIILPDEIILYTSIRTVAWAREHTKAIADSLELSTVDSPIEDLARRLSKTSLDLAIDQNITAASLSTWREKLAPHSINPRSIVEQVRQIKSPAEIALMQKSQQLNESVLGAVLPKIRPHMTERGVQGLILAEMARNEWIDGFSFEPIVAVGPNCWEIHHLSDDTVIGTDQMLLIDLGVRYQGYASDMTRTLCLGQASPKMRDIHHLVSHALESAISAATAGITNRELDQIAREIISDAGFGKTFTHGLGHHIGLETHDPAPPLSAKAPEIILAPGMALTIEPGIYLENQFGVRTEDIVIITDSAPVNLTRPSHQLLKIPV